MGARADMANIGALSKKIREGHLDGYDTLRERQSKNRNFDETLCTKIPKNENSMHRLQLSKSTKKQKIGQLFKTCFYT